MSPTSHPIFLLPFTPLRRHEGALMAHWLAYVTGLPVMDLRSGRTYRRREKDVIFAARYGAEGLSLEEMAHQVESSERKRNAVIGRRVEFPLPNCLDDDTAVELCKDLAHALSRIVGSPVIFGLHRQGNNLHVHFLILPRVWHESTRQFGNRVREMDVPYLGGVLLSRVRVEFAKLVNLRLPEDQHVRCSPKPNGPRRRHLGHGAHRLEQDGVSTLYGDYNRLVDEYDDVERKLAILRKRKMEQELGLAPVKLGREPTGPLSPEIGKGVGKIHERPSELARVTLPATPASASKSLPEEDRQKAHLPMVRPSFEAIPAKPAGAARPELKDTVRDKGLAASEAEPKADPAEGEKSPPAAPVPFILRIIQAARSSAPGSTGNGRASAKPALPSDAMAGVAGQKVVPEPAAGRRIFSSSEIEELLSPPPKQAAQKIAGSPATPRACVESGVDSQTEHPLHGQSRPSRATGSGKAFGKRPSPANARSPETTSKEESPLVARPRKPSVRPSGPLPDHSPH